MDMALRGEAADFHPHVGWVKIGFTHAFKHLAKGSSYLEAIREVLTGGGDTDTNACIVGGLIGAALGVADIPEEMKQRVLGCDTSQGRHKRPKFLMAYQVPDLVKKLL
jgi:ADP-ribosylglycohydrolase